MDTQGTGGCLLFNTRKQAVNPGKGFGPYGLPKSGNFVPGQAIRPPTMAKDGIRANAVNADRVRTGSAHGGDGQSRCG